MLAKAVVVATFLLGLWTGCEASYLSRLETRTGDGLSDGMTSGRVDVKIYNVDNRACKIDHLNNAGNSFAPGNLDVFEGDDLDCCQSFFAPFGSASYIELTHHGVDGWQCDYINLEFFDGSRANCPGPSETVSGDGSYIIYCTVPAI